MALFCFLWLPGIESPPYILIISHTKCFMFLRLKPAKLYYLHTEKYVSIYDFFLFETFENYCKHHDTSHLCSLAV